MMLNFFAKLKCLRNLKENQANKIVLIVSLSMSIIKYTKNYVNNSKKLKQLLIMYNR